MKILIFDLDETLVSSFTGKLLISEAVLQILKELADSPDYILTIASFNDSAHEILEDLGIQHLFSHVSAGFKKPDQKIHSFPMSKIDNVQEILDRLKELPENRFVFFDNELVNCNHVKGYHRIPTILINSNTGVTLKDIYLGLDYLDGIFD